MDISPSERDAARRAALLRLIEENVPRRFKTQREMAESLGLAPAHLSQMKSGNRTIGNDSADKIEQGLGLRVGELDRLGAAGTMPAGATLRHEPPNVGAAPDRTGRVPLISWVQAGDWSHAADLLQPGEAFEWIDTSVMVRPHTFALRVKGDSMEPEFAAGTILVIEPEMDANPGDYVIAKNGDDEATFKQLVRDGADLYLKPLNARYPIKPLGHSRIVGVVREAVKRYR